MLILPLTSLPRRRAVGPAVLAAAFALLLVPNDAGAEVICHFPPGNRANFHTLEVGAGAVAAHLRHGDLLGPCNNHCEALCEEDPPNLCTDNCDAQTGACVPATPVDCNDGDERTLDSCDPVTGCLNLVFDSLCEDGLDNDLDGAADCQDSDCARARNCRIPCGNTEITGDVTGHFLVPAGQDCTLSGNVTGSVLLEGRLHLTGTLEGDIEGLGDLNLSGRVLGDVTAFRVTIEEFAAIDGNVAVAEGLCGGFVQFRGTGGEITGDVLLPNDRSNLSRLISTECLFDLENEACRADPPNRIGGDVVCTHEQAYVFPEHVIGQIDGAIVDCQAFVCCPNACGR